MQFTHVSPARIADEWPAFAEILWPAVRADSHYTLEVLRKRLVAGMDHLIELGGPCSGLMVWEVSDDLVLWIKGAAGKVEGGPKARMSAIRGTMKFIEQTARDAGCTEVRVCGRDWSKILPDYQPFDGFRNGLKKGL